MNDNMNNNTKTDNQNAAPYKAMGNLNTVISNPSVNINNTMDVNIQSLNTPSNSLNESNNTISENASVPSDNAVLVTSVNTNPVNNGNTTIQTNAYVGSETTSDSGVKKTFVTNNKPKKKTISFNIGPEFKIALLIIVILLIFIFLLPLLPNFF